MATSRLLDPFYVLGTRLDLTGRRARRLMMAAFEALDPRDIATDMATEVVTYDAEEDGSLTRSLVDVLVDHFLDAQIEALDAASEYLSAVAPGPAGVLAPADGFLGQMGNQTVRAFVERTPQGIVARITSGMAPEDALAEAADYIAKVGDAEPHIIGRDSVATVANNDDRFAGYARVARPDACAWCKMLAGRGAVYTKDTAILTRDGQPYHQKRPNGSGGTCRCRMVAVPVDHLGLPPTEYTPPRAGQYAMTTSRYREGSGTPERAGSIDRQLQILRQQLATGKGTDWTRARIARLESERMSSALGRSSTLFLRYDPNQPRDKTGKWSASGGGGGGLPDGWVRAEDKYSRFIAQKMTQTGAITVKVTLQGFHGDAPGTKFVEDYTPDERRAMEQAAEALTREVDRLTTANPVENLDIEMDDSLGHDGGVGGMTSYRDGGMSVTINSALLNPDVQARWAESIAKRRVEGDPDDLVRGVMAHEYGHVLAGEHSAPERYSTGEILRLHEAAGEHAGVAVEDVLRADDNVWTDFTLYAQSDPAEAYAELFADWSMRGPGATDAARILAEREGWR